MKIAEAFIVFKGFLFQDLIVSHSSTQQPSFASSSSLEFVMTYLENETKPVGKKNHRHILNLQSCIKVNFAKAFPTES